MRSTEQHQSAQSKLRNHLYASQLSALITSQFLNLWLKHKNPILLLIKSTVRITISLQFRSIGNLKQTSPKIQSCLYLRQAAAYLNFNCSLGILHMFQSCINVQCHYQPRCKPQRIIRFTGRLNDICSSSVELLGAKRLAKIRQEEEERKTDNRYCS